MCDRSGSLPRFHQPWPLHPKGKTTKLRSFASSPQQTQHWHGNFSRVSISDTIDVIWQHLNSYKPHKELITATKHFTKNTPHSEHSTFTCLCATEVILTCKVYCHDPHRIIFCTQHSYCLSGKKLFSWNHNSWKDMWLIYSWFILQTTCAKRLLHHQLMLHENGEKHAYFLLHIMVLHFVELCATCHLHETHQHR